MKDFWAALVAGFASLAIWDDEPPLPLGSLADDWSAVAGDLVRTIHQFNKIN